MHKIGTILRNILFYLKYPTCEIRTSKPRKNYIVNHIESDYSKQRYQADTVHLADYISNNTNINLRWLIISQSLDRQF